jgi:hypothetical protein
LHVIQEYYPCCVILVWPDEHTPFSVLMDYLNAFRHGTVEILWIVIDRLNGPISEIFQVLEALSSFSYSILLFNFFFLLSTRVFFGFFLS